MQNKSLRLALLSFVIFISCLVCAFVSPLPAVYVLRFFFRKGIAKPPKNYALIKKQVKIISNVSYPSMSKRNNLDIYRPLHAESPLPIIIWLHGGAFVGGSKQDVAIMATVLASQGYAVVCPNYQRAPEAIYPSQIKQIEDVYNWLCTQAQPLGLDHDRIIMAGDSAGAYMAAQFTLIQTNGQYAKNAGFKQIIAPEQLKGALLCCGPYNLSLLGRGSNKIVNYFIKMAAWAYMGTSDWLEEFGALGTIKDHLTGDFPPTFLTDGNLFSFEDHGKDLANALDASNVPVTTFFIAKSKNLTRHEYQFIMNQPSAEDALRTMLAFLKSVAF